MASNVQEEPKQMEDKQGEPTQENKEGEPTQNKQMEHKQGEPAESNADKGKRKGKGSGNPKASPKAKAQGKQPPAGKGKVKQPTEGADEPGQAHLMGNDIEHGRGLRRVCRGGRPPPRTRGLKIMGGHWGGRAPKD